MLDLREHVSADHLSDYLRGALGGDDETEVEAHIGACLVCARRLREEAQLEVLLYEAAAGSSAVMPGQPGQPGQPPRTRRALWQRIAASVANSAAAAAALLVVIAPGQPLTPGTAQYGGGNEGAVAPASVSFINDALCTPTTDEMTTDEECMDSVTVAMTTDPEDYLSPFDREWSSGWSGDKAGSPPTSGASGASGPSWRGSAVNACLVEDLACEPG